ncbi:MAG: Holliday junction branch migration protein RuvA [Legionellales bacterium]|nr:Holliday junction branch migration protein RuvA [Legionellales bacterium]OUX66923.1 MAG: Holliday junction branch migration protein RuvA [bacterium TMED178]
MQSRRAPWYTSSCIGVYALIHSITGQISHSQPPFMCIDVSGVGYEVECSQQCFHLGQVGASICVYTHLVVREDAHALFGFSSIQEREVFRVLIKVSGVGPKMAIAIISHLNVNDIIQAIMLKNTHVFLNCKGVGKRVAEKIIVECQNKFNAWVIQVEDDASHDAVSALVNLGYKKSDVQKLCQTAFQSGIKETTEIIKFVLGELQPV